MSNTIWSEKMPAPPPPTPAYNTSRMSAPQKSFEKVKLDLDELRGEFAALKKAVIGLENQIAELKNTKGKAPAQRSQPES